MKHLNKSLKSNQKINCINMFARFFVLIWFILLNACGGGSHKSEVPGNCVVTNCHGAQVTCGFGEPTICTEQYMLGDLCRSHASCEIKDGECGVKLDEKYTDCLNCIKTCEALSPAEAFVCDDKCRNSLN